MGIVGVLIVIIGLLLLYSGIKNTSPTAIVKSALGG